MNLPDSKYLIAAAIVVFLIVLYVLYKRRQEKVTDSKKRKKSGKLARTKKSRPSKSTASKQQKQQKQQQQDDDDDEPYESDGDAQELYNLVHDRMASGMQSDEFLEVVNDMGDNLTYIEIKQLYNDARNRGQDPLESVTIDDYAAVLSKRSDTDSE